MDRSLFWLPADKITFGDMQAFLNQQLEESVVLDYTEVREATSERDLNSLLQIVVAMANTDGGIILAGVSKDPHASNKPGELVGLDPKFIDSLKNKCRSLIQPAFLPEICPIQIPNKNEVVLLIRINPERHPRPVVLREKGVLVRVGDSNQHADLYRLQQLFTEKSHIAGWPSSKPNFSPDSFLPLEEEYNLMVRFALSGIRSTLTGFNSTRKKQILSSLAQCPINKWISHYTRPVVWGFTVPTTSYFVTMRSQPIHTLPDFPGLALGALDIATRFHVSLPARQETGSILLDVWLKELPKQAGQPAWYPLGLEMFYELLLTGLATITDPGISEQSLEGFSLSPSFVFTHINAKKAPWLDLSSLQCIGSLRTLESFQSQIEASQAQRIMELDRTTKDWLSTLLSNSGCMDYESRIQNIGLPGFLHTA